MRRKTDNQTTTSFKHTTNHINSIHSIAHSHSLSCYPTDRLPLKERKARHSNNTPNKRT